MKTPRKMPPARPSKPIASLEPPGYGPWWAFMMVNVAKGKGESEGDDKDSKKQTEVRLGEHGCACVWEGLLDNEPRTHADTGPLLVKNMKNALDQGDWAIIMQLGPFYELDFAFQVLAEWSDGTRGQGPRIAQGICLGTKYESRGIRLLSIKQTKQEVQQAFREKRERHPTGRVIDASQAIPCL